MNWNEVWEVGIPAAIGSVTAFVGSFILDKYRVGNHYKTALNENLLNRRLDLMAKIVELKSTWMLDSNVQNSVEDLFVRYKNGEPSELAARFLANELALQKLILANEVFLGPELRKCWHRYQPQFTFLRQTVRIASQALEQLDMGPERTHWVCKEAACQDEIWRLTAEFSDAMQRAIQRDVGNSDLSFVSYEETLSERQQGRKAISERVEAGTAQWERNMAERDSERNRSASTD